MEPFFPYCKTVSMLINMLSTVTKKSEFWVYFALIIVALLFCRGDLCLYFQINITLVYLKLSFKG